MNEAKKNITTQKLDKPVDKEVNANQVQSPTKSKDLLGSKSGGNAGGLLNNLFSGVKTVVIRKDAEMVLRCNQNNSLDSMVLTISKAIEEEKSVNIYSVKGVVEQYRIAKLKVYTSAKVVGIKKDERNEKKFNAKKLSKNIFAIEQDKAAKGMLEGRGAIDHGRREAAEAAAHELRAEDGKSPKKGKLHSYKKVL